MELEKNRSAKNPASNIRTVTKKMERRCDEIRRWREGRDKWRCLGEGAQVERDDINVYIGHIAVDEDIFENDEINSRL